MTWHWGAAIKFLPVRAVPHFCVEDWILRTRDLFKDSVFSTPTEFSMMFPLVWVYVGDERRAGKPMLQTPHVDIKSDPHSTKPTCTNWWGSCLPLASFSPWQSCTLASDHVHCLLLPLSSPGWWMRLRTQTPLLWGNGGSDLSEVSMLAWNLCSDSRPRTVWKFAAGLQRACSVVNTGKILGATQIWSLS